MEQGMFGAFRQVASRLTRDPQLQKDLMQEMFVHLLELRRGANGQPAAWYVRRCEIYAREYLVRLHGDDAEPVATEPSITSFLTYDQLELVRPRLSVRQREVFERLRQGQGIRETGRLLGISHVAVIKHRKKITKVMENLRPGTTPQAETENAALQAA